MIINKDIHPKFSLYYIGAIILKRLKLIKEIRYTDLFLELMLKDKEKFKDKKLEFSLYLLALDWLYIIDSIKIDKKGIVKLCL